MNVINICDCRDERLSMYTECNETQLFHYYEPHGGVFVAETPMVIRRALDKGYEPISFFVEDKVWEMGEMRELVESCGVPDVPVFVAPWKEMREIIGYNLTRGALAAFKRKVPVPAAELLAQVKKVVVLEEVLNPTNVGAIYRSAAALGAEAVLITNVSADPLYRRAARVSVGTVFSLPFTYFEKGADYMSLLKSAGFTTVSLALRDDAVPVYDPAIKQHDKLAVIFGNEANGIKPETLAASDYTAIIPMFLGVDSLNVAAASAVTFYELFSK